MEIANALLQKTLVLPQDLKLFHCDIKADNIIYNVASKQAQLVDFGIATEVPKEGFVVLHDVMPNYMAPEVCRTDGKPNIFSEKSEVYALGKVFESMLCDEKRIPYKDLLDKISEFIKKMLHPNPEFRPKLTECIEYFNQLYADLLKLPYSSIGIIDGAEFLQSTPSEQQAYICALKYIDEVWLVDAKKNMTDEQHYSLQGTFENAGINLTNHTLHSASKESKTSEIVAAKCADTDRLEQNKIHN